MHLLTTSVNSLRSLKFSTTIVSEHSSLIPNVYFSPCLFRSDHVITSPCHLWPGSMSWNGSTFAKMDLSLPLRIAHTLHPGTWPIWPCLLCMSCWQTGHPHWKDQNYPPSFMRDQWWALLSLCQLQDWFVITGVGKLHFTHLEVWELFGLYFGPYLCMILQQSKF